MALDRAVVGALSHAELVDLVVRQSEVIDQLRATIAQQQALIARLEARIRELEEERDRNDPTKKMPGLKPAATPRRKSGLRKRRAHGFSRGQAPAPTETVLHAVAVCPQCATPLSGGTERWRKEVLELPPGAGARHPARVSGAALPQLWPPGDASTGATGRAGGAERAPAARPGSAGLHRPG